MNTDPIETLSAFLDGEAVDPKQLAEALTAPGAREALRDFALIRADLLADDRRPGPAFYRRMSRLLEAPAPRRRWWAALVPVPVSALAAAAVLVVVLGVWVVRVAGLPAARATDTPPAPDRVVEFRPGVDWNSNPGSTAEPPKHEVKR